MKYLKSLKLSLLFFLALTSCSSSLVPIDKNEISRLSSEPKISVVTYTAPPFFFETAGDQFTSGVTASTVGVLTGGLGGLFVGLYASPRAEKQGEALREEYLLEDPIGKIKDTFVASVSRQFKLTNLNPVPEKLANDDIEAVKETVGEGTILDFKTENWSLTPAPLFIPQYQVTYGVRSRLFRTADGDILWQGYCLYHGKDSQATLEELKANGGALLRSKLEEAGDACAKELIEQFLR